MTAACVHVPCLSKRALLVREPGSQFSLMLALDVIFPSIAVPALSAGEADRSASALVQFVCSHRDRPAGEVALTPFQSCNKLSRLRSGRPRAGGAARPALSGSGAGRHGAVPASRTRSTRPRYGNIVCHRNVLLTNPPVP